MFKAASGAVYRGVKAQPGGALQSFNLPLADAGAGAVSLTAFGQGSITPTFTRATTAWTKLSTGLWAPVASGTARSSYLGADTTVGAYGGYLAEGARTNLCLQSRDLSNASWTKVNTTGAKDQVGIDGAANSASSLVATAIGGTCLQTITEAATLSALSLFIKRITGTGTVTIQQGASTSEISGSLNSSTYTRVELDATVLNPAIGITFGTSGDKIAVDMVQFENGGFASSPIPTTTVAVTRNADALTYPVAGNLSGTAGTAYVEFTSFQPAPSSPQQSLVVGATSGTGSPMYIDSGPTLFLFDGTAARGFTAITLPDTMIQKVATSWGAATSIGTTNGITPVSRAFDGDLNLGTVFGIGATTAGGGALNGTIRNIRIYPTALSAAQLKAMTS